MNLSRIVYSITSLQELRQKVLSQKNPNVYIQNSSDDTFEMSISSKLNLQAKKILSRTRKFDIDSYNSLSKTERSVLMATSKEAENAANASLKIGIDVKKDLDRKYGEGNYVFVSIGTSPSGVARVLEFMGVETKYLPISGLSNFWENDSYKDFSTSFPKYKDFLTEQGLSKEKIESSGKKYLFFDYTRTGRSLSVFENIMKEYFGIDSKNVSYRSFDYECYSSSAKHIDPEKYAIDYISFYVSQEHIAEFGGVAHLPLWELDNIDQCKKFESENSKKFNFLIIDTLRRKKLLKNNPANNNSL